MYKQNKKMSKFCNSYDTIVVIDDLLNQTCVHGNKNAGGAPGELFNLDFYCHPK